MNGSLKLSLAVALALGSANALALGLGSIQVKSGLNEPLNAEIPVTGGPDETAGVSVALAAAADFERVGLSRSRILVPLDFQVAIGAKGNAVIKVTSKEPVRDPFLDFLIEVNWAKGKLLREYTVLLDPPTMAPAVKGSRTTTAPLRDSSGASTAQQLPGKPTKPGKKPEVAATEPATPSTEPKPAKPAAAPRAGDYGPVAAGETLWEVASATKPDDSVSLNQMMISLLRSNPSAFYKDNINSLKRGAILRVPSVEEIKAAGNAAAAAADVRSQNEIWRSGTSTASTAPTLITDTGAAPRATSGASSKPKPTDRLELVPPKTPRDNAQAGAERAGSGSSGAGDVTTRAELARTKEALASREQESNELKSRVKELEDLKSKNDKLISLKDSELAELQKKLRELQDKASKAPTTTVVATPPATSTTPATTTVTSRPPPPGVTKEDVWGSASGEPAKPATSTTTPATTTSSTGTTPAGSTTPSSTSALPSTPATTSTTPGTTPTTPATTTGSVPPASTTTPPPNSSTLTVTPPATTPSTTPSTTAPTTPDSSATSSTATPPPATTPPKPAVSTTSAVKPTTPAKVQPLPVAEPWYRKTWVLGLGGLALLSVVVLALMNLLRRPKAAPVPVGGASFGNSMADDAHAEEQGLLERLAQYPDDTSAHLELASLYYAQQDVDKFEAAAQAMYAHISDTASPEWEQVRGMGAELAPHNPLFVDVDAGRHHYPPAPEPMRFDNFEDAQSLASSAPATSHEEESGFDFDLTDRSASRTVPPPSAAPARDDFSMDLPPPSTFDTRISMPELQRPPDLQMPRLDDELATIDDAIGTKLDLAKAYLDMGDPDGARSMLEEVMGEGSDAQRNEARRLLSEIR